jgi:Zn-dependent protease with chaperone function
MTLGLCFWILMLIWLVFSVAVHMGVVVGVWAGGNILLLFLLFLLLGWQVFGPPLHRG